MATLDETKQAALDAIERVARELATEGPFEMAQERVTAIGVAAEALANAYAALNDARPRRASFG